MHFSIRLCSNYLNASRALRQQKAARQLESKPSYMEGPSPSWHESLFFSRNDRLRQHIARLSGLNQIHGLYWTVRTGQYGLLYYSSLVRSTTCTVRYSVCVWSHLEPKSYIYIYLCTTWHFCQNWQRLLLSLQHYSYTLPPSATSLVANENHLRCPCQLHELQEELVRDAEMTARLSVL